MISQRQEILAAYREKIAQGRPIIGGGAGTGLSAKCAEEAGLDFIVIYNSGRYRMAGRSSMAGLMPYGDANAIVADMTMQTLPIVKRTPVVAGVCASDPFRVIPHFLRQLKDLGCAGVQNYPTVCLFEGMVRANLEETGLGFDREVEMIAAARELDLLTVAYVATEAEAKAMVEAGADILVPHMGLTTAGMIGAETAMTLDEAIERSAGWARSHSRRGPTSSSSVTAGRSPDPRMSSGSWRRARAPPAFSVARAWNGSPRRL